MSKITNAEAEASLALMAPDERAEVERRFWSKTRPNPRTGCLKWIGGTSGAGCEYGSFSVRGAKIGAHRVAYLLGKGPIPPGMSVRHSCHTRGCVAPACLSPGTPADNARDTVEACRHAHGIGAPRRKMTAEDDRLASELRAVGWSRASVAADFGVEPKAITAAVKRHARRVAQGDAPGRHPPAS